MKTLLNGLLITTITITFVAIITVGIDKELTRQSCLYFDKELGRTVYMSDKKGCK